MCAYHAPSKDTLRALETAPNIYLILSPDLYILTASDRYLEATETTRGKIVGKHIFEAFPDNPALPDADGVQNINASLQEVLRTKKPHVMRVQRYDVPDQNRPGNFIQRYWDPSHTPVFDDQGDISYIIQLANNVTEKIFSNQALARSQEQQKAAVAEIADLNRELLATNRELNQSHEDMRLLNIQLEDRVSERTQDLINSNNRVTSVNAELQMNNDALITMQQRLKLTNEELISSNKSVLESEQVIRMAMQSSGMGTWQADLQTGQLVLSQRGRELHGLKEHERITLDEAIDLVDPQYRYIVRQQVNGAIHGSRSFVIEYLLHPKDGSEPKWLRATGLIRLDDKRQPRTILGSIFDITEQKKDDQRKNDFIGMVSHELKTPLTSLSAILQVMRLKLSDSTDTFLQGAAEKANMQVKRMSAMINSFLNVSRLESGKIEIDKQMFDLNELISETVEELRLTANGFEIALDKCPKLEINADRDKIASVVSNLINNAVKYSPRNKRIEVYCIKEGDQVTVRVKDQGVGISANDMPRLFDRYYRVESAASKHIAGFGIGLYLSAEIVDRHGGKIWAESEPGKGSVFSFSLPVSD